MLGDNTILETWAFKTREQVASTVYPDGCRDLILKVTPGARPLWFVSDLDSSARTVRTQKGVIMQGVRFKPGTWIDVERLCKIAAGRDGAMAEMMDLIAEHTRHDANVDETLECLASDSTDITKVAIQLGITPRTLQRFCLARTGKPPSFWRRLARARRVTRSIICGDPLSDIAHCNGYADQAHMSRDIRRWFGITPLMLRRNEDAARHILASGYP